MTSDWWRGAVMYQVYPRSFRDTTGNGTGDLAGVARQMDYIASLGVDGLWLSPCFESPMKDFGYDISDHCAIDPLFGTMDDFDMLLHAAHARGLKLILDQVYSHTSARHRWFQESCQNRENPKADWYVWADANPDNPDTLPNNWRSLFGGPAWTWVPARNQFYMHNFLKEQPDLNYHTPAVQDAILEIARFWLERGVDGLRLDVINFCFHDAELRDNPPKGNLRQFATQLELEDDPYNMQAHLYDKSRPEMFGFLKRLRELLDQYPNKMLLGEMGDDDPTKLGASYSDSPDKLHTTYGFGLMRGAKKKLTASYVEGALMEHFNHPGEAWPSWAFSNHDVVRALTRFTPEGAAYSQTQARLLMAVLCSLYGTIFLYQGEELGLPEAKVPGDIPVESLQDPWGIALYPKAVGRDGCRTPMPWTQDGGFSSATPWLPIPDSHKRLNVAAQEDDPHSTLTFTRRFLAWRKQHPALIKGAIQFMPQDDDEILLFSRRLVSRQLATEEMVCIFNLSHQPKTVTCPLASSSSLFPFKDMTGRYDRETETLDLPSYGLFFGRA